MHLRWAVKIRAQVQADIVARSSDDLIAYMAAETSAAVARLEVQRTKALAFCAGNLDAFLPEWARGRFPFDKPKLSLMHQLPAIERFLAPLNDKRARRCLCGPPAIDDDFGCGNVGSENDA